MKESTELNVNTNTIIKNVELVKLHSFIATKRCLSLWINGWLGKIQEASLPEKEDFYGHLNMGDITDADYVPSKRVCKDHVYHDLL